MLTKVILENFKSFKNKCVFDLEATKYQALQNTNVKDGVVKGALVIGPNASGKSTLIEAIRLLLEMFFADNFTLNILYGCLFGQEKDIGLEYHFKFGKSSVVYKFGANYDGKITYEELDVNNKVLLERKGKAGTVLYGNGDIRDMGGKFSDNVLLFRKCFFNDVFAGNRPVEMLMAFLKNSAYVNMHERQILSYSKGPRLITDADEKLISEVNTMFSDLNLGFELYKGKEKSISHIHNVSGDAQLVATTDNPIVFFKRADMNLHLPLMMESTGNQALANIILSVYYCCKNNSLLLIDEFSSGFHNKLEEVIIRYVMRNSDKSQVIFVSHSTNLLNTTLLRPDQIYTVDFKPGEGSFIERVSDENPREAQNLEKMYLSGKFGALPDYSYEDK